MNLHALYLYRLAQELNDQLVGACFSEIFSNEKNHLHLLVEGNSNFFGLNFRVEANNLYLYPPSEIPRSGRNRLDHFKGIWNKPITAVRPHAGERSFSIYFGEEALVFLCHGRHANLFCFNSEEVQSFRKVPSGKMPNQEEVSQLESNTWPDTKEAWIEAPFMTQQLQNNLESLGHPELLKEAYLKGTVHLIKEGEDNFQLDSINKTEGIAHYSTLYEALREACELQLAAHFFRSAKDKLEKSIQSELTQIRKRLKALAKQQLTLQQQANYRHLGDLILSNLPQIHLGNISIQVHDYLSGLEIEIPLKETLSPQDNAQRYYRKAKNQHIEEERIQQEIESLEEKEFTLLEQEELVSKADIMKTLRPLLKEQKKERSAEPRLPYHVFTIEGYQVLVGKQAKDNDELSLKIAKKDDLWLHARDIPGSHVIIRKKSGQSIPEKVIEMAGGLALWFSKRRKESLAPVIYTEKKFLRKRKGDLAGAVVVEKENVMMVAPLGPDQLGKVN